MEGREEEAEEGAETLLFHEFFFYIVYEFCMNLYQSILQN